jgi:5-methylcytosine-specific restriction endonuclease McrA
MESSGSTTPYFLPAASPEEIRTEKEKARKLRKSQWWQRQLARGRCHYCAKPIPPRELTMDHVLPLIRGGRSSRGNVVPACKPCNCKKKYYLPLEWDEYISGMSAGDSPVNGPTTPESKEENDGEV